MQCELEDALDSVKVESSVVRDHLARLLASRSFGSAKRLRLFLTFVVEKTLNGESDALKEYVIATEVYGRSVDYDPQVDSTVRVEASRLRAKLRDYYASEGADEPVRIELPKGAYVPTFRCVEAAAEKPSVSVSYLRWKGSIAGIVTVLLATAFTLRSVEQAPVKLAIGIKKTSTVDPVVLEKYLKADQLLRQRVLEDGWSGVVPRNVVESIALFQEVTKVAPSYAKAWAGLAEAQEWAYELDREHPRARIQAARAAAEHAVALDPGLADAHSRLAAIYLYSFGELNRAEQETTRTLALNPRDIRAQARYVDILRMQGKLDEALRASSAALAVDSSSARLWAQRALVLYDLDRVAEAMSAADHALQLNPGNQMNQLALAYWIRGLCLQQQGILDRAEAEFRKGLEVAPQDDRNQPALGHVLAQQGRAQQARDVLTALQRQHDLGKPVSYGMAVVYAGLGEMSEANRWLERSAGSGETSYRLRLLDKRLRAVLPRA